MCIHLEIYFKEWAHAIMEAVKSKISKAGHQVENQERADVVVQVQGRLGAEAPLAQGRSVFILAKASLDWMKPTYVKEVMLLYSKSPRLIAAKKHPQKHPEEHSTPSLGSMTLPS